MFLCGVSILILFKSDHTCTFFVRSVSCAVCVCVVKLDKASCKVEVTLKPPHEPADLLSSVNTSCEYFERSVLMDFVGEPCGGSLVLHIPRNN